MSDKLRKALIKLINEIKSDAIVGKVVSIDSTNYTCDVEPLDEGAVFHDVRLKPSIDANDKGVVSIPKANSFVIISPLNETQTAYFVLVFTEVTAYHVKVDGGASLEFDNTGNIKLNAGLNGGLPLITPLKAELIRLESNINAIKTAAGAAISVYSAALDGGVSGSTYNAAVNALPTQNLTTLENTKVKQ